MTMRPRVSITVATVKMGAIPSANLDPASTCSSAMPCWRNCYARRFLAFRPSARRRFANNARVAAKHPASYFASVCWFIALHAPRRFRWHAFGEIPGQPYLDRMIAIARDFPRTGFLVFTKRHDLNFSARPANLLVRASVWPGWGDLDDLRARGLPIAFTQDGTEHRIPATAKHCPGNCARCRFCWSSTRDVWFDRK